MQSKATTIAAYLKELPDDRRKVMKSLVALARKHLVGFDESIEYGMPYFKRESQAVGICSQKNYISVYGLRKQVVETGVSFILTFDYNNFRELFGKTREEKLLERSTTKPVKGVSTVNQ